MKLALVENPDIIASVVQSGQVKVVVGFAAETNDTLNNAREKRARKGLDAIVVNDVSDRSIGFNSTNNAVTLIHEHGEVDFWNSAQNSDRGPAHSRAHADFHRKSQQKL